MKTVNYNLVFEMKKRVLFLIFIYLFFSNLNHIIFAQSPYKMNWPNERTAILGGTGLTSIGTLIQFNVPPLTVDQLEKLSQKDVWSFDRSATDNWSPMAAKISDILLITNSILPTILLLSDRVRDDDCSLGVFYLETMLITYGINSIVKGLTNRIRPFVYNEKAPLDKKLNSNVKRSFYSGHTAQSFAGAVLTAKLFNDHFPNSNWKEVVWGTSLISASCVGYLRYAAGKHFPSDVIVGAIMGSVAGYLVPFLHKKSNNSNSDAPLNETKVYQITIRFAI